MDAKNESSNEPPWIEASLSGLEETIESIMLQIQAIQPKMAGEKEQTQLFELLRDAAAQEGSGLKPRSRDYITANIQNFITIYDAENLVACGELIEYDMSTVELGAVATNIKYQNQGMSDKILDFAEQRIQQQGKHIIIVTDNPTLIRRLEKRRYSEVTLLYPKRSTTSPGKKIYTKFFK